MSLRVIPRLDIKAPNLVKGIRLEGLRVMGNPSDFASRYFEEGADEIFYQDIVASLYGRSSIVDLVTQTAEQIFVPLTVGGGIRSIDDIHGMLRAGADKVSLNTAAVARPELIAESARRFGTQCIVVAVEMIRQTDGRWKVFTENGRQHTGLDAFDWAMRAVELGAGELLLTSVDREGTGKGFDLEFVEKIVGQIEVPVLIHGGAGSIEHMIEAAQLGVDGIVIAKVLHSSALSIKQVKQALQDAQIEVRR